MTFFLAILLATSFQPEGWDADIRLRDAFDKNPDPRIVEIELEAAVADVTLEPGRIAKAWTYNGGIPGPLIRTRAGDRLIVHFRNNLPQPTTVHWHGMRVPIQMDGVPGHSQAEVPPGGTFTYDFVVPDAGLYWYHPHVMSAHQVGFGLYGALLVEDPAEKTSVGVGDELVLVLSDIDVEDDGALRPPENTGAFRFIFGLEGNHVLVNGRKGSKIIARAGVPQRWRIVNAAKSRYFHLALEDPAFTATPFSVIGGDGGLHEYAVERETIVIAPGERVDAIVTPVATAGSEIIVRSLPFSRGYGSGYAGPEDLITMAISDSPALPAPPRPTTRRTIETIEQRGATPVELLFRIVELEPKGLEYRINNTPAAKGLNIRAAVGETQIWTIKNETDWSHPFHLHGFFFQVLDEKGAPVRPLAWKDTVNVPHRQTLSFVVRFDDRQGNWMYHCHILDHAEGGLMGTVEVGETHTSCGSSHCQH